MADAKVTVSSEDLMVVKQEEGKSSCSNHETPVILHLQPILQGVNDGIAGTGTTVLAIETHDDESKEQGLEIEYGYPITCGDSKAVLLFKKFVCPGINIRCVKFNDQLISPKQFVHLAGKATLKDWKRAIRLGGVMLRKMMDSGQIDFYQHDTACSNTCRSTKFDVLINSTRLPPGTPVQPSPSGLALDPLGGQLPLLTGRLVQDAAEAEESWEDKFSAPADWSSGPALLLNPTANGHAARRKRADTPDEVLSLWKGVSDSGLMGDVLSSLHTELLAALKGVEVRSGNASLQETDAIILNSLCEMFGLLDSVKQALDLRGSQTQESRMHDAVFALRESRGERREQGCERSTYSNHDQPQHPNPSDGRTQKTPTRCKTSSVIQAPCPMGLAAASYAQLSINPQLLSLLSTSAGQLHHTIADGMIIDRRSSILERNHKRSLTGGQETPRQLGQRGGEKYDSGGSHGEPGWRIKKSQGAPQLRSGEAEDTEGLCHMESVIIGRKASKKQKSK